MTRETALQSLRELGRWKDMEEAHIKADTILCELLKSLGYRDVVEAWDKIDKWFV